MICYAMMNIRMNLNFAKLVVLNETKCWDSHKIMYVVSGIWRLMVSKGYVCFSNVTLISEDIGTDLFFEHLYKGLKQLMASTRAIYLCLMLFMLMVKSARTLWM